MVTPTVKDVVQKNATQLKIINTGVKTFVRCDNKNMACAFRLSQEGLQSISPYISASRRIKILKEDLILVLQNDNPSNPPDVTLFSEQTQTQLKDLATGSCILEYEAPQPEGGLRLTLVGWRGVRSLRAYTPAPDTVHYLRLLGADYSKYDINKFKKASDLKEAEGDVAEADAVLDADTDDVIKADGDDVTAEAGDVGGADHDDVPKDDAGEVTEAMETTESSVENGSRSTDEIKSTSS